MKHSQVHGAPLCSEASGASQVLIPTVKIGLGPISATLPSDTPPAMRLRSRDTAPHSAHKCLHAHMPVQTHAHTHVPPTHMLVHTHAYAHVPPHHMPADTHACTYTHLHTHTCTHTCLHICASATTCLTPTWDSPLSPPLPHQPPTPQPDPRRAPWRTPLPNSSALPAPSILICIIPNTVSQSRWRAPSCWKTTQSGLLWPVWSSQGLSRLLHPISPLQGPHMGASYPSHPTPLGLSP